MWSTHFSLKRYAVYGDEYLVMPCLVRQHNEGHVVRPEYHDDVSLFHTLPNFRVFEYHTKNNQLEIWLTVHRTGWKLVTMQIKIEKQLNNTKKITWFDHKALCFSLVHTATIIDDLHDFLFLLRITISIY